MLSLMSNQFPGNMAPDEAQEVGPTPVDIRMVTEFLKALAHEGRLAILCNLVGGEKSVGQLENLLGSRQAAVSQQLARLRHESLVKARRQGKTIYYSIDDPRVLTLLKTLCTSGWEANHPRRNNA